MWHFWASYCRGMEAGDIDTSADIPWCALGNIHAELCYHEGWDACLEMWFLSLSLREKAFGHRGHWYGCGYSPVWFRWWALRVARWLNFIGQSLQQKGRPPACTRMWEASTSVVVKASKHTWHLYGSSCVCVAWCLSRRDGSLKAAPHSPHEYERSPTWTKICRWSWELYLNLLSHRMHSKKDLLSFMDCSCMMPSPGWKEQVHCSILGWSVTQL